MKNKFNYLLYTCNIILVGLISLNIFNFNIKENEIRISDLSLEEGKFISYLEKENPLIILEENNNDIEIEYKNNNIVSSEEKNSNNEKTEIEKEEIIVSNPAIEILTGSLVGYGPDCYGCTSQMTASGQYIGNGNIYYNDDTYGKIRIVAGDYSYPFGTIVKISNVDFYNDEPFYAIILDRGGDIGKNKTFLFDLLFASESEASKLGKEINIKYEIVRLGY